MAFILMIDSSGEEASIHLGEEGILMASVFNKAQKDHAAWIHRAIDDMLKSLGRNLNELDAIGITSGPGSYTGLRVSMATAKGLCYALNIPLMLINSLELLAASFQYESEMHEEENVLVIPMMDARRMEVFVAAYDYKLVEVMKPQPLILETGCFDFLIERNRRFVFVGSGVTKWKTISAHDHAGYEIAGVSGQAFLNLVLKKIKEKQFTDLAYAEPVYLKEFYTHQS